MTTVEATDPADHQVFVPVPRHLDRRARATGFGRLERRHQLHGDTSMDWMSDPANPPSCAGLLAESAVPDNMIFPSDQYDHAWTAFRDAVCATCPLTGECYEFGLTNEYPGVWGGQLITQAEIDERRAKARQRRRDMRVTVAT